ncbi:MAG: ROK family protein [Acidobacteria bacterium]|nr:ROK family protein [Acidobacteriota bacterium]
MSDQTYYIGLDLGDALIKSALVNSGGEILEIEQRDTPHDGAPVWEVAAAVANDLQSKAVAQGCQVVALGAGIPGVVNPQTRRVESSPALPALEGIDLLSYLASTTQLPVVLEQSANAAAYGEFICGAARGMQNVIFIDLGPDISAGLILEGNLYRGQLGSASGFGHMTVNPDGWECTCGNVGCLETIASGTNLVRRTTDRLFHDRSSSLSSLALPGRGELTPQRIAMEALNGDDFALMMLERTGKWVGMAVASVINLLNLDMVVMAGSVMVAGDLLLRSVIKEVQARALKIPRAHCRIVSSTLGGQAGFIGAAMRARDSIQS